MIVTQNNTNTIIDLIQHTCLVSFFVNAFVAAAAATAAGLFASNIPPPGEFGSPPPLPE